MSPSVFTPRCPPNSAEAGSSWAADEKQGGNPCRGSWIHAEPMLVRARIARMAATPERQAAYPLWRTPGPPPGRGACRYTVIESSCAVSPAAFELVEQRHDQHRPTTHAGPLHRRVPAPGNAGVDVALARDQGR